METKEMVSRVAAVLALVALAIPARAAQTNACTVFTDAAGDATVSTATSVGGQFDDSLDLLSGSFSATSSQLHVELHLGHPGTGLTGRTWQVSFADGESEYAFVASQQADGDAFNAFGPGAYQPGSGASSLPPLATVSGRVDLAHGLIVFDAPLSALRLSSRSRFQNFRAHSGRSVGTTGGLLTGTPLGDESWALSQSSTMVSDEASGVRNYRIDRGCRPFS